MFMKHSSVNGRKTWIVNEAESKTLETLEMWCWRRMERINGIEERKSNREVFWIIGEKCSSTDSVQVRPWKMVGHEFRRPEELRYTIIEGAR